MGIRSKLFVFLTFLLLVSFELSAQVVQDVVKEEEPKGLMERTIDQAIERAPFRAGAFWVRPTLNIFSGYDSNSLLLSVAPDDDLTFQAIPGVVAILPFRTRALLEIEDQLEFVYYRDTDDLRGVFNTVGARFTIGGNRVLFSFADRFSFRQSGVTQEVDTPAHEQTNNFDSYLALTLGKKSEARIGFRSDSLAIEEDIVPIGIPLSQFYDQKTFQVNGEFRRYISPYSSFIVESYYEKWDFAEESLQPDADLFAVQAGFSFQAKGNITGQAVLGYKVMTPTEEDEAEFNGLIGRGEINFRVGERTILGLEYTRDARPSIVEGNWFFIENRIAPSVEFFITRNFSIYGLVGWMSNSYPRDGTIVTPTGEITTGEIDDTAIDGMVSLRYKIKDMWQLYVSGYRLSRDSNSPNTEKERDVVLLGIQTVF
jgi:hypothetical protein